VHSFSFFSFYFETRKMAMYILCLTTLENDDQSPNLTIKLLDPKSQLETTLEIKNINRVEFQEKNIGSEEQSNLQTTWKFFSIQQETFCSLEFIVLERYTKGLLRLRSSQDMEAKSNFFYTTGSNVLELINDAFNSIEEIVNEYNSKKPVHTPPTRL